MNKAQQNNSLASNPLLNIDNLPLFNQIKAEQVTPAIDKVLEDNRCLLQALLKQPQENLSWPNFFQILEDMDDRLQRVWSPVSHLHGVKDSDELRQTYTENLEKITLYQAEFGQNSQLYAMVNTFAQSDAFQVLDLAQKKIIENMLRDFRLAGIALPEKEKQRFKEIKQQLARLKSAFEQNLLDATQAWSYHCSETEQVSGLPETALAMAAEQARNRELSGWVFTLDFPSYYAVMTFADNQELRREMYSAYVTRASDQGPDAGTWDNGANMVEILNLRQELAELLGFKNYAEFSLETKMAESSDKVIAFLQKLVKYSRPIGLKEIEDLKQFAAEYHQQTELDVWDYAYFSEKMRQQFYDISQQEVKEYFPEQQVLEGMFEVVQRLYQFTVRPVQGVETWHPDVRFFEIVDERETVRGQFYLDLYARQNKRAGAWMDECVIRRAQNGIVQVPVAYLTCNLTPPVDDIPALFSHDEVITIFHEFGHGLHHMLTQVDYTAVSGINGVAWDAVELPSQFFENWCWEVEPLRFLSKHYQTGQSMPDELIEKLRRARNFQSAMQMLRQLEFALFDFCIHSKGSDYSVESIQQELDRVRQQVAVVEAPEFNRFQHGFAHIFAGGYAAGYYSYKWAEVLSADAFDKFLEEGIFNPQTGQLFLSTILQQGGTKEPLELFTAFRGREPEIEALLKQSGILATG